jgi:hypothetical protein
VNRQFQNLSQSLQPPRDRVGSEVAERDNQGIAACSDRSVPDPSPPTDCVNDSYCKAERTQRERWIGFLARHIAIDILRKAPVKEDGKHD